MIAYVCTANGGGGAASRDRRERSWEPPYEGSQSALDERVACREGRVSARDGVAGHEERPVCCVVQRQALRWLGGRAGA